MILLVVGGLLTMASAQEAKDWRLDLLKANGLSAETEALETFQKGLDRPIGDLGNLIRQLGSDDFKEREQAQKEILLMGKGILPQVRPLLDTDDPEVRIRLTKIISQFEGGGRWTKEDLLREAVTSLLEERKKPGAATKKPKIFVEMFNEDAASVSNGYQRLKFKTGVNVGGSAKNGIVRLEGNRDGDGDQQLMLRAEDLTGNQELPDSFSIECKIGGEAEGAGAYHVGISVGNVRALFHPGYQTGSFRFERVSDHFCIMGNTLMGFTPPAGELLLMSMDVDRLPNKDVSISVKITHNKQTFRSTRIIGATDIGKLDRIGLDRSGKSGGDALFDDLIVDLKGLEMR